MQQIEIQVNDLKTLPREELKAEWQKHYGLPPPKNISHNLLIRSIAYKYQEALYGGLSPAAQKELARLIREYRANPENSFSKATRIKPGTRLIRMWKGRLQEVTATEKGFFYEGSEYGSLSEVARTITGTRWSGVAFFGLGKKGKAKVEVAS